MALPLSPKTYPLNLHKFSEFSPVTRSVGGARAHCSAASVRYWPHVVPAALTSHRSGFIYVPTTYRSGVQLHPCRGDSELFNRK